MQYIYLYLPLPGLYKFLMRFRNPRPLGVVRDHQGLPEGLPMLYYLNCPHSEKGYSMSRFIKIAHVLWHCQYHLIWVPKYRYKIMEEEMKFELNRSIRQFCEQKHCIVQELNIQSDHVHMIVLVPPKVSISDLMGALKGRSAIRMFRHYPNLKTKPYCGNHFWAEGYCVDTVGVNEEMIRKYVRYQENQERKMEQQRFKF